MKRRVFLCSAGVTAMRALLPVRADAAPAPEPFEWTTQDLSFAFDFQTDRLRQKALLPAAFPRATFQPATSSGVETAIHCSGENSPDAGMKQAMGLPGSRLVFVEKREETTKNGRRLAITHSDPTTKLRVESFYEAFNGAPVVRRWTKVTNDGATDQGIEFLSSAMLHALADRPEL